MREQSYVLVADTDGQSLERMGALLRDMGPNVITERDGAVALRTVQEKGPPRLLVVNAALPSLDGFALLKEVRSTASAARCPAVLVSASWELRDTGREHAKALGIEAVVSPTTPAMMLRRTFSSLLTPGSRTQALDIPDDRASALADPARLAKIEALGIVTEPLDDELQAVVADTAKAFHVPISLVSIVTPERQWFKAHVGTSGRLREERGTPIEEAFCRHVVESRQPLVVNDAALHPGFQKNPLVRNGMVRSYVGAPVMTSDGHVLGTLCIVNDKPQHIPPAEVDKLVVRARAVAGMLERKAQQRALEQADSTPAAAATSTSRPATGPMVAKPSVPAPIALDAPVAVARRSFEPWVAEMLDGFEDGVFVTDDDRRVVVANQHMLRSLGVSRAGAIGLHRDELVERLAAAAPDAERYRRTLQVPPTGAYALQTTFEAFAPQRLVIQWTARPLPWGTLEIFKDVTHLHDAFARLEQVAYVDAATGLASRAAGEQALAREASRASEERTPLSIALFHLDNLAALNDAGGYAAGDAGLRTVGQALLAQGAPRDHTVRWAGAAFVWILPGTREAEALSRAVALRDAVRGVASDLILVASAVERHGDETLGGLLARASESLRVRHA
jgi:diguanylate cyclase (GGDEF)-like protein